MTRMSPAAAVILALIVVLVAAFSFTYRAGLAHGATNERTASLDASRKAIADSVSDVARAKAAVAKQNDSLHALNEALHLRNDSLEREVVASRSAAIEVRARLVVAHDTAAVTTDSGVVRIPIPSVLAEQLALERASMDSSYAALERRQDSVTTENRGLLKENAGLRVEISLDSVQTRRLQSLADSDAVEIDVLKKASRPRFTFAQGVTVGAGGTLLTVLAVMLVF